jgi:ElaB/YqjD/DUF883 family membrane-anchored ribosome-binding protein
MSERDDVAAEDAIDARIAEARHNLSLRLAELDRRVEYVKHRIDPRGWIDNPWARVGVAAAIGLAIGYSETLRDITKHAASTALSTLVHQAIAHLEV